MRILQLNSVCGYGSTGRIVSDLSETLKKSGHSCLIAYGRGRAPEGTNAYKIGSMADVFLHGIKTRAFDLHGFGSKKATIKLIEAMKSFQPEIIHLHNIHGYYVNIEVLFDYLSKAKIPVVWTLHDCWSFTGHCSHFDYIGCERWKTGCYSCCQKTEYPGSKLFDNSKRNYEKKKELFTSIDDLTIVTPSLWLEKLVKGSFLSKYPIKTINNGIDLNVFHPDAKNLDEKENIRAKYYCENKFIILGVASVWSERKGMKFLVELAADLSDEYRVVVVGINEIQKLGLPKNIVGIIRTNNTNELAEIYSMADVFVNPTLEDSFPTTNLESLACGTPVITFNTGGSAESIDDSCGVVVEKSNMNKLYNEILKMKASPISKEACLKKAQSFDKNEKYKEYIDLYDQVKTQDQKI